MLIQHLNIRRGLVGRAHLEAFSNPGWLGLIERHAHRFAEIHLVVHGHAVLVVGNQRVELPSGSLLWLPPRLEHLTLETTPSLQRWILAIRDPAVRRILGEREASPLLRTQTGMRSGRLSRQELFGLCRLFEDVASESSSRDSLANAGIGYALTRAMNALQRTSIHALEPTALHPVVARALSLIDGDGLLLSRRELASRCRTSPTHLSRLFVRELGQPFREVRNKKRLARFQLLMTEGRCESMTEAALEAGFGSYSQFHRVFRRLIGTTPSEWCLEPSSERGASLKQKEDFR